jgi:DMSO/TMAO reductase YedYZ molybdopterin-dependent catalytic subunit
MKRKMLWAVVVVLTLALVAGCGEGATAPAPTPTAAALTPLSPTPVPPTPAAEEAPPEIPSATLELTAGGESKTLGWDEIQALPAYEGVGGRVSSVGTVTPPTRFKGVTLEDLCGLVGGITPENSVTVSAKDGYAMTFSYDQIVTGDFATYDPATGDELPFDGKLWVVVAYEEEGEAISDEADGPLRLAVLGSQKLVTDGHWWVKWVEKVEVKQSVENWSLHLEGALSVDVDRGTFETGSAPNCHGTSWTDAEGQTWTGVPLWLLAGQVDDENKHEEGAFNDDLAAAGYEINVVAGDGYSVTLDSVTVARNDEILVAYLLDDEPLPEKHWPLRLVGPDLPKSDWVGNVVTIEVVLP